MDKNEYVTVVAVENGKSLTWPFAKDQISNPIPITDDSQFITVVAVNECMTSNINKVIHKLENVTVIRLPGERIGFGLKFEGGAKNHENIERLFIQSCSPGSPASRAVASWGNLKEGDEILEIDGVVVTNLTRLECVRRLKESTVEIKFLIRNGDDILNNVKLPEKSPPPPPPPVPPRKIHRRKSMNDSINNTTKVKVCSTPEPEFILPPDPELYTNLFENELLEQNIHETESDDTGSTISTVIDHFSISSDTETSLTDAKLEKVLKTFTQLEEMHKKPSNDIQPAERKKRPTVTPPSPPTPLPRQIIKIEPKIMPTLEPIKIDSQLSSQFTTIHNWLQDTSDVVHECIIMVDENGNEFNTVTQDKIIDSHTTNNNLMEEENILKSIDDIQSDMAHGIGPSEAYFNIHWGPSILPTIGEVEEEFSSMEHQSTGYVILNFVLLLYDKSYHI